MKIQNTIRNQLDTLPRSLNIDTNGILFLTKLTHFWYATIEEVLYFILDLSLLLTQPPKYRCLTTPFFQRYNCFNCLMMSLMTSHHMTKQLHPHPLPLRQLPQSLFARGRFLEDGRLAKASGIVHAGSSHNMTAWSPFFHYFSF